MSRPSARAWERKRKLANGLLWGGAILATIVALVPLALLLSYVAIQGVPHLSWSFFTQLPKPVGEPGGGMAHAVIGSLLLIGLAGLVGLPVGILGGIYLAEFGNNRFGGSVRFAADVLSGVPSIVIGIFVYTWVVIPMHRFSALAGGLALGILMIPIVMRTTEEMFRLVPTSLREAALALGATPSRTIIGVVLPAARGGVITGVLLAVARVAGETAPLLMTALGFNFLSARLDQPIAALPLQIFVYAISPYEQWHAQAWAAAVVLVALVTILSLAARYFTRGQLRTVR